MNYYKLDLNNIFASLFVTSVFLSDLGIVIYEQPIFLNQVLAIGFLIVSLYFKPRIEKGWIFFFIAITISFIANISILTESRQFRGDTYPWTSIKNFLNVIIFYAVYKTTIFSYNKINPNLFYYLSIVTILYCFIEILFVSTHSQNINSLVGEILKLFHTNPGSADHLSLFGREPSYGSLGNNILICFMIYFYYNNAFKGIKSLLTPLMILILSFFSISTGSKGGILSLIFLSITYIILIFKNNKIKLKSLLLLFLILIFLPLLLYYFISSNHHKHIYESILGEVGSGSTFGRWSSLRISWAIFMDNIFWGIGGGNFKLFYLEYVDMLNIPVILEVKDYMDANNTSIPNQLNYFAGIFSEYGIFTFIIVFYFIFKKIIYLFFFKNHNLQQIPISILVAPAIFVGSISFYYWGISFIPFYLAFLEIDYKNRKSLN
jgi:hypothetical protein